MGVKARKEEYKSRVYTDRPAYADYDSAAKFQAIQAIIARRLTEHPHAICSYSGGADSDIMIDLIERTREMFSLTPAIARCSGYEFRFCHRLGVCPPPHAQSLQGLSAPCCVLPPGLCQRL